MNVFKVPEIGAASPRPAPLIRPAIVVLVVALLVGGVVVTWRAVDRVEETRTAARMEAQARAAVLELQFQQAISAAEILTVYGQQSVSGIPGFPGIAANLLATRPAVATIELQPYGVVRDVIPKSGNERLIGLNVRTDPAQALGVEITIKRRMLTVCGPLPMRGGQGIVARVPLFERTRTGAENFWGLAAVSMRLQDAFSWARVDDLYRRGYKYAFFQQGAEGKKPVPVLWRGNVDLSNAEKQSVRVGNLDFRLAVEPRGGWFNAWLTAAEALLALFLAGLLCAVVNLFESRRALEEALDENRERLSQETRSAGQSQQESRLARDAQAKAQADAERAQAALREAESRHVETQALTEQALVQARQDGAALREELAKANATAAELQLRLETTNRENQEAAQVWAKEEQASAAALQTAQARIGELNARLEVLTRAQKEAGVQSEARATRDAGLLAELQGKYQAAEKAIAAAEARAQKLPVLEATAAQLKSQLKELEPFRKQAADLAVALAAAQAELTQARAENERLKTTVESAAIEPVEATEAISAPEEPVTDTVVAPAPAVEPQEIPAPAPAEPEPPAVKKVARPKKARRDDQMDFFAAPAVAAAVKAEEVAAPVSSQPEPTVEIITEPEAEPEEQPVVTVAAEIPSAEPERKAEEKIESVEAPAITAESAGEAEPHAAAEAPETTADLPVIEGLVTADGLAWAEGNHALYLERLRHFAEHQATAAVRIRNALERGEPEEAGRVARALKAESGEVGAIAINSAATALERAIHDRYEPGDIEVLWAEMENMLSTLLKDLKPVVRPREEKPAVTRAAHVPPVNVAELRKAVGVIVPLLADRDPGAKDCWRDNRTTFRSAFSADGYTEFERSLKSGDYLEALEALKKAAKKHGITV